MRKKKFSSPQSSSLVCNDVLICSNTNVTNTHWSRQQQISSQILRCKMTVFINTVWWIWRELRWISASGPRQLIPFSNRGRPSQVTFVIYYRVMTNKQVLHSHELWCDICFLQHDWLMPSFAVRKLRKIVLKGNFHLEIFTFCVQVLTTKPSIRIRILMCKLFTRERKLSYVQASGLKMQTLVHWRHILVWSQLLVELLDSPFKLVQLG